MSLVFISHSSTDIELVEKLRYALESKGINVWASNKNIDLGSEWNREIERAIQKATHVLVVTSSASVQSSYVLAEVEYALANNKKVIPLLIEKVNLPLRWHILQYFDMSVKDDFEVRLAGLIRSLPNRETTKQVLVTAGNVVEETFKGVCYAVKTLLGGAYRIEIFDTLASSKFADDSKRQSLILEILGTRHINITLINDANAQQVIPETMSQLIREYGPENVIVDLSNGQKITTSILYAASTISRITNIFALEFKNRPPKNIDIADLQHPEDWDYIKVNPLEGLTKITQSSYIELIYYRDRIEQLVTSLKGKNPTLADKIASYLQNALVSYFYISSIEITMQHHIENCISALGKVCEEIAFVWHHFCQKEKIITTQADSFNSRIKQIVSRWNEYRNNAAKQALDTSDKVIKDSIIPTLAVDTTLEIMHVFRNFASHHGQYYVFDRHDARLALDATLLMIERLLITSILDK